MADWTVRTLTEALSTYPLDMIVEIDQGCGCCSGDYKGLVKEKNHQKGNIDVVVIGYRDED